MRVKSAGPGEAMMVPLCPSGSTAIPGPLLLLLLPSVLSCLPWPSLSTLSLSASSMLSRDNAWVGSVAKGSSGSGGGGGGGGRETLKSMGEFPISA